MYGGPAKGYGFIPRRPKEEQEIRREYLMRDNLGALFVVVLLAVLIILFAIFFANFINLQDWILHIHSK